MGTILIAGCGYIGNALAPLLAADGHSVLCARRRQGVSDAGGAITSIAVDLADGPLDALARPLDAVVFAAAPGGHTPESYEAVYVRALARVLALNPGRLLLTSSTSVYGQAAGEWVDEASPAESQAFAGATIRRGERLLRPGDVAVRLGGIYGPGRESFLNSVRDGSYALSSASPFTNRIHRDDAAAILRHVLALPAPLPVYNAVDSAPVPRDDVAAWIAAQLGITLARGVTDTPPRGHKRVSNERLLASGYEFRYPTYREGYGELIGRNVR